MPVSLALPHEYGDRHGPRMRPRAQGHRYSGLQRPVTPQDERESSSLEPPLRASLQAEGACASPEAASAAAAAAQPFADDLVLARACVAGDQVALARLVRRLACIPRVIEGISARLGHPLDRQELEDLGQETLVLAWRKLDSYTGEARLESWIFGLARLELMNALRRKRRRPEFRAGSTDPEHATVAPPSAPDQDRDCLMAAVASLDPAEADVVRLKHFEALTFEDMAERLCITTSTAKTRYYRGLARLHERLRGRLGEKS